MADRVVQLGVPRDRVHIIRNWANTEVVRPVPPHENRLRGAWQLDDRFVVMYSGNMGVSHSFDELLRVARQLRKETEIVFLIVGGGRRLGQVRRYVEEHGLDNVRFQGFQPYARLAESLSAGDVHFISLRSGFEGLVVPSKAYGVLAAGRPIIYLGDPGGEIGRMVSTDNLGIVVAPGDVDGLRTAVLKAFQDARWRQSVGERARGAAEVRYSMARAMSAYAGVLATLNRRCGDDPSSS
jgi:glycosyltransferase involved in cell wall biosynthesis